MEVFNDLPAALPSEQGWETIPIPSKAPLAGYVAGPFFGTEVHWYNQRNNPCKDLLTRGAVPCPRCAEMDRRPCAYLALYSAASEMRYVVFLSQTTYQMIEKARFGDYVVLQQDPRPRKAAVALIVRDPEAVPPMPAHLAKLGPIDITPYLLRLWGLSGRKARVKKKDVKPPVPAAGSDQQRDPATVGDAVKQLREQIKKRFPGAVPSTNGHHSA